MKITSTSVILGISAVGLLVLAAYYMKGRMNKDEKKETEAPPATQTAPTKPAPTQESLMRAAGMGSMAAPRQQLVQTPVGFMMN